MSTEGDWTRVWDSDRLTVLCRDPSTLWVYWELRDSRRELIGRHFATNWDALALTLRTYDITDIHFNGENAHRTQELSVPSRADNAYLWQLAPGRVYCVDLGLRLSGDQFFTILRSDPVATPPVFSSADNPLRFMRLGEVSTSTQGIIQRTGSGLTTPYEDTFDGYSAVERQVPHV